MARSSVNGIPIFYQDEDCEKRQLKEGKASALISPVK